MTALKSGAAQSVRGCLELEAAPDAFGRTVLMHRHASGGFHLSKPYWDGSVLLVQWINPTAGVFPGDELRSRVALASGAAVTLTSPSATRVHTRRDGAQQVATIESEFHVAADAVLDVQPEWFMPQRGSACVQRTHITVASGGSLLYSELLAPGRVAHGESLSFQSLDSTLSLRVGGRLRFHDRLSCRCDAETEWANDWKLRDPCGRPLFVLSSLISLPQDLGALLRSLRGALTAVTGVCYGVSQAAPDVIAVRATSLESLPLRQALAALRAVVHGVEPRLGRHLRKL
jgi:urease accessory protein